MFHHYDPPEDKITLIVDEVHFVSNRKTLSMNSDYFKVMFNGNFTEKDKDCIAIQDVTKQSFKNCLEIIDGDNQSLKYDQILETLQCACMLQFEDIRKDCIYRLTDDLRIEYYLEVWQVTESLDIHPLCEFAKCRALVSFDKIRDSDSILQLNIKQLHLYLANTLIFCDNELDIFKTGMKWWYENSPKLKENVNWTDKDTTKYLYTILSCVDFKSASISNINDMLTYPDIRDNGEISMILGGIVCLMEDPNVKLNEDIKKQAEDLFFNSKSRDRGLLPCIVTSEFPWQIDQTKRSRMDRAVNIAFYNQHTKSMEKLFPSDTKFSVICRPSLYGSKILPYKDNLIMFGGEVSYGSSNWNNDVWLFHCFKNSWKRITRMPRDRRHFNAIIIEDKLFILGGTGKYRIKVTNEMMMYDFSKDLWFECINIPHSCHDIRICEYQKQLFLLPAVPDNKYGFIFCKKTFGWIKLNLCFPPNCKFDFTKNFVVFAKGDTIYILGSQYVEMQVEGHDLRTKTFEVREELHGDRINYYLNNDNFYIFSKHVSPDCDPIFQLHCFNLKTKKNELLVQVNDSVDKWWHIKRGCFAFFHYNLTKKLKCISEFPI